MEAQVLSVIILAPALLRKMPFIDSVHGELKDALFPAIKLFCQKYFRINFEIIIFVLYL